MLSDINARRAAGVLVHRLGEVAIAMAMLRAQEAESQGRYVEMVDWRRIAQAAATQPPGSTAATGSNRRPFDLD
jgi:hypothetical protein